MKYIFDVVNDNKEIVNPTFEVMGVNIVLTDENGEEFGVEVKVEDLNINDKVLIALEKNKV